ncbi:MAG: hypothetical protein DDT29_01630 [Dehalococcoidia bacterium]|nr:hypothetical protein [Bacillota bacterium]
MFYKHLQSYTAGFLGVVKPNILKGGFAHPRVLLAGKDAHHHGVNLAATQSRRTQGHRGNTNKCRVYPLKSPNGGLTQIRHAHTHAPLIPGQVIQSRVKDITPMFPSGGIGPSFGVKPQKKKNCLHRCLAIKDSPPLSFLILSHNFAPGRPEIVDKLPRCTSPPPVHK